MIAVTFLLAIVVARAFIVTAGCEPEPPPRCRVCGARFLDSRAVDWHQHAAHPLHDAVTADDASADEGSISKWNR